MPTIYDAIKQDHILHHSLLARIAETKGADRRAAWAAFYYDVKAHAAAEEETFYSKLMSKTWGQEAARHSVHEHQLFDDRLDEMHAMDIDAPDWIAQFAALRRDYEHHIAEEEAEIFTRARSEIDDSEIEGYGQRFLDRKAEERKVVDAKLADRIED